MWSSGQRDEVESRLQRWEAEDRLLAVEIELEARAMLMLARAWLRSRALDTEAGTGVRLPPT